MFRYFFSIIICALGAVAAVAQSATGWYKYPTFTEKIDNIVETTDKVYYRSGTNLFSYRESDNENMAYSTDNLLSDVNISEIYYNPFKKYLLVAYDNGNIDLLYDSGKSINLPDIKDAKVYGGRNINNVSFNGDYIYVATDFGFVIFDEKRYEVKESAVFNKKVNWAGVVGDYAVIYSEGAYRKAPLSGNFRHFDSYTTVYTDESYPLEAYAAGDNKVVVRTYGCLFICIDITANTSTLLVYNTWLNSQQLADGSFFTTDGPNLYLIPADGDGSAIQTVTLPQSFYGNKLSFNGSHEKIWAATKDGIVKFNLNNEALTSYIKPDDCITVEKVNLMTWSPDYERLYISRANPDKGRPGSLNGSNFPQTANIIENRVPRDASVRECTLVNYWNGGVYQQQNHDQRLYGGNYWMYENPFDKEMYFVNSDWNSVIASKNGKMVTSFTSANSKFNSFANRAQGVFIDPRNNLWMVMINANSPDKFIQILPADKIKPENIMSVTADDWKQSPVTGLYGEKNATLRFCKKSNFAYYHNGNWGFGILAYDTKGTYDDPSDDEARQWATMTDQDGKTFSPIRVHSIVEDKNGQVWVGTTSGVCVVTDPTKGLNDNFTVRRPKVPREDGTNFADYLLESDAILWIGVDPANNKWLATESSGLYLVNPDGTKILAHYNTTNSPLASNTIYTVEQDPFSNLVYVGTDAGLYRFNCSTAPAADDYSEIYAYPNPVRPEYTGQITITGLTDSSLVKITDAAGNLIAQTTANGGMALWDGCNMSGKRVRSGVYYVFASSGPNAEQSEGAVTKIVVIN